MSESNKITLITKPVRDCPPAIADYLAEIALPREGERDLLELAHVVVGVCVEGSEELFAVRHVPDGTEHRIPAILAPGQPGRLVEYFSRTYANPNLSGVSLSELPPDQFNCYGFGANMAGSTDETFHPPLRFSHNLLPHTGNLKPGETYLLEDTSCDLTPHAILGIGTEPDQPKDMTLSVIGNNSPLLVMPLGDALPFCETDSVVALGNRKQ
jgi:hypothetical protein